MPTSTPPPAAPEPIGVDPAAVIQALGNEVAQLTIRATMAEATVSELQQQLATQRSQNEAPTMDETTTPQESR